VCRKFKVYTFGDPLGLTLIPFTGKVVSGRKLRVRTGISSDCISFQGRPKSIAVMIFGKDVVTSMML